MNRKEKLIKEMKDQIEHFKENPDAFTGDQTRKNCIETLEHDLENLEKYDLANEILLVKEESRGISSKNHFDMASGTQYFQD